MAAKRKVVPAKKAPAKKSAPKRNAAARNKQDIKDILNWLDKQVKSDKSGASSKIVKGPSKIPPKVDKIGRGIIREVYGDPSKGWQDVAITGGSWFLPYGKGAKVVNKVIKGTSKGKKVVRGVVKTAGVLGGQSLYEKGVKSVAGKKKGTGKR